LNFYCGRRCLSCITQAGLLVGIAIALGGRAFIQAAPVQVTRLDGSSQTGELLKLDDERVVVASPAGEQSILIGQLMSLRWAPSDAAQNSGAGNLIAVELTDSSILPVKDLRVAGKTVTATLALDSRSNRQTIELPMTAVASVRFQRMADNLQSQWEEIRGQKIPSDLLIILKRDGNSLDYVEGVVGEISEQQIEFKLDGEANRVDRTKVAGIIYYRNERVPLSETRLVLAGQSGLRANLAKARISDASLIEITTAGGVRLNWPLGDLQSADYSGGNVQFLSDLEPASTDWSPLVGLPPGLTVAAEYGKPLRDESAFGGKLAVVHRPGPAGEPAADAARREFDKGLALRSRTELAYRLPPGFSRLRAIAGIDPAATASGNVRVIISADDRQLVELDVDGDDPPQPIDVDVVGAKRLTIVVDFGRNQDGGDWLNLCDAKFIK
jgi:hypothetical protein